MRSTCRQAISGRSGQEEERENAPAVNVGACKAVNEQNNSGSLAKTRGSARGRGATVNSADHNERPEVIHPGPRGGRRGSGCLFEIDDGHVAPP